MIIAVQVILLVLVVVFSMGLMADVSTNDDKNRYLSVSLASLVALMITFFMG
jgi:hypothetical protein